MSWIQTSILQMKENNQDLFQGEIYRGTGTSPNEKYQLLRISPKYATFTEALNWCEIEELNLEGRN